ncbi:hypothetical protein Pint_21099 [Pistacia integerrima]|uniref:Uncharacterized protein n=1 Tax=Pistacia integerrima TaxID=434235 RepID=A0ACC0X963_9ROSI|nr:hypothetical protein Pint_21099 [Pistacia integerrima]
MMNATTGLHPKVCAIIILVTKKVLRLIIINILIVGGALGLLVQNIATIIAGLVIDFETNWEMALIVSVLLPLVGINGYIQMKYNQGYSADAKKIYKETSQVANNAIGSIRTVASFCAEEKVMEIYQKKCEEPLKASIRQGLAGPAPGVWVRSGSDEEKAAVSRAPDDSDFDEKSEKFITSFLESCQDSESEIEVEVKA